MVEIFTVGHGNRRWEEFLDLLRVWGIHRVVDVRSLPHSPRNPHFSKTRLETTLPKEGIGYMWEGKGLGGFRRARADSPHTALEEGLRGYADHMETLAFRDAAGRVLELARQGDRPVILCAETNPLRCHRRLLADYFTIQGASVRHILSPKEVWLHRLHPSASVMEGRLCYNKHQQGRFPFSSM